MTKKLKQTTQTVTTDTKTVIANASRLVEATSLLVVAGYAFNTAYHNNTHDITNKVVLAASIVIFLRGAWEFFRYLANKEVK